MKNKLQVNANSIQTPPGPTHIHQHTPSAAGELLIKVFLILVAPVLIWHGGIFLFNQAGITNPARAWSNTIIYGVLGVGTLYLLNIGLSGKYEQWLAHREYIEGKRLEQVRHQQLMNQSALTASRQQGEHVRFAALIYAVMYQCYEHYARYGKFSTQSRPYSRRQVAQIVLDTLSETEPVGPTLAEQIRPFLEKYRVIVNDQLNIQEYPDLASVQRLLYYPLTMGGTNKLPPPN